MLNEITDLLDENLGRVDNLVSLYGEPTPGRRKVHDTDLLRAALVLLHASMEDYLRSLLLWKIGEFDEEALNKYGFPNGTKRPPTKITLGELSAHRGKTVDDLIEDAVKSHLEEFQSFNDLGEVKRALKQCGIGHEEVEDFNFGELPAMISRRHNIVHKADRNDAAGGQGNHKTKSISKPTVVNYVQAVKELRDFVTGELG
jgi:hypothetical protein